MKRKRVLLAIIATLIALLLVCTLFACTPDSSEQNPDGNAPDDGDKPDPENPSETSYTVTFVTNGGNDVPPFNGTTVQSEPQTQRSGYVFAGWFASADFSTARITFPYTLSADITFYAKWDKEATAYTQTTLDDFEYTEENGVITLTSYKGSASAIRLPDEADVVGESAILNSEGESPVTAVLIPAGLTGVNGTSFYGAALLGTIEVEEGNSALSSKDGVLFSADGKTLISVPFAYGGTSYVVPAGTEILGAYSFVFTPLQSVTLPDTLVAIEDYAFYYAPALTEIDVPAGVTEIGDWVFAYATSLEKATFGEGLTTIGLGLFRGCTALKTATFPSTLRTFGNNGFQNCSSLTEIVLPAGLETCGGSMWIGCSALERFTGPVVATVGLASYAKSLSYLEINAGESIGSSRFSKAAALETVILPDTLKSIGQYAFQNCTALTSIAIPDSVTSISTYAFDGCSALESFVFPSGITSVSAYVLRNCSSLVYVTIPEGVTEIGNAAFDGTAIKTLRIPDSCTKLDSLAIKNTPVNTLYIPAELVSKINSAYLRHLIVTSGTVLGKPNSAKNLLTLHIAETVTTINLSTVSLYKLVQVTNLSAATFDSSYTGEIRTSESTPFEGVLSDYNAGGIMTYTANGNVYAIDLADGVTEITAAALADCTAVYPSAFSYNSALVSATIPHNVKEIGESAFSNCRNLASVTIENGVESIGNLAFLDTNLLEVTIPSSVTTMGNCVFGKNSQMVMVHCMFPSQPEGWHSNWFGGYSSGSSDVPYEWIG